MEYLYWLELVDKSPIRFGDLALLLASAKSPPQGDDHDDHGLAWWGFEVELTRAMGSGELTVRHPITGAPMAALSSSAQASVVVYPEQDLRPYLERLAIGVRYVASSVVTPPRQRALAHGEMVLAHLRANGFDPKALPKVVNGKPNPAKQAAKHALVPAHMTEAVFGKAWQDLRDDGALA
jgi:hypothetical protein